MKPPRASARTPHPEMPSPGRHTRLAATASHAEPHATLPAVGEDARIVTREPQLARKAISAASSRSKRFSSVRALGAAQRLRKARPARMLTRGAPVAALLAVLLWLLFGSYWQTRQVHVEGSNDPTILALVRAQRLTNCDAFRCDFSAAQRAIAASPRVANVNIGVVFPATTLVRISPRQTAAVWRAQGQLWAIGADGVVIGSATQSPALASPLAATVADAGAVTFGGRALRPGARLDPALIAMARQLRSSATDAGLDVASLRYTSADGFTMQASASSALVVFGGPADALASLEDIHSAAGEAPAALATSDAAVTPTQAAQGAQTQAQVAGQLLRALALRGVHPTWIDVRWGSHPYYR